MKIDLNIRPMTLQEKIYAGLQSSQISQQTGFIGVLVGSFNQQDKDLSIKWNILQEPPIREAFWSEAQSVLKELRNTIFKDRNAMQLSLIHISSLAAAVWRPVETGGLGFSNHSELYP